MAGRSRRPSRFGNRLRLLSADPYLLGLWRLMKGRVEAEAGHFDALAVSDPDCRHRDLECIAEL